MISKKDVLNLIIILNNIKRTKEEDKQLQNGMELVENLFRKLNVSSCDYCGYHAKLEIASIILDIDKMKEIISRLNNKAFW